MKIVDFISVFFLLIVVLVLGHAYLTWQGAQVADEHGNYDLRKNVDKKPSDDFSKAYEGSSHKIKYSATFEHMSKRTE